MKSCKWRAWFWEWKLKLRKPCFWNIGSPEDNGNEEKLEYFTYFPHWRSNSIWILNQRRKEINFYISHTFSSFSFSPHFILKQSLVGIYYMHMLDLMPFISTGYSCMICRWTRICSSSWCKLTFYIFVVSVNIFYWKIELLCMIPFIIDKSSSWYILGPKFDP